MVIFPNAKINLGLHVSKKRVDGYHDIETVFYPVPPSTHTSGRFSDVLEVLENHDSDTDTLNVTGNGNLTEIPQNDNLVIKALQLIRATHNVPPLKIHLHKTIPSGAGLGGGSSDAAHMLMLLNKQFNLGLSTDTLMQKASTLGADCAFFIHNKPVLATGIGDEFAPVNISLKNMWLMIVAPPIAISTPESYRAITPQKPEKELKTILNNPVETWRYTLINDFEPNAFSKHPELATIKNSLYKQNAVYVSMSGSGSAIYGIFEEEPKYRWPIQYISWVGQLNT
jgi:4-diphosphocytidyl-2-C-methyl-D-erythritol kinase